MLKFINYKALIIWPFIIAICSVFCYFGALAHADGGEGFMTNFLFVLFYVLAFPFLYILDLINIGGELSLIMALITNSFLYSLLIERTQYHFKKRKRLN